MNVALLVNRDVFILDTAFLPHAEPWHDVAGMFVFGNQDNISRLEEILLQAVGNLVHGMGAAGGIDNFIGLAVQQFRERLPGLVVQSIPVQRKRIVAPVHIGRTHGIELADSINHTLRFLRGGAVIKIDQIRVAGEKRKVFSYFVYIEHNLSIFSSSSSRSFFCRSSLSIVAAIGRR